MADEVADKPQQPPEPPKGSVDSAEARKTGAKERRSRLEKMTCFPHVKSMLENAESVTDIVYYIQNEAKEYTDVTERSLKITLWRYIRELQAKGDMDDRRPTNYRPMLDTDMERVDVINGLNLLLSIQYERIQLAREKERKIGIPLRQTNEAMRSASQILMDIDKVESSDLFRRLKGMPLRDAKSPDQTALQVERVKQSYIQKYGEARARIISDDGLRRKMITAVEKIRKGESQPLLDLIRERMIPTTTQSTSPEQSQATEVISSTPTKPEDTPGDKV